MFYSLNSLFMNRLLHLVLFSLPLFFLALPAFAQVIAVHQPDTTLVGHTDDVSAVAVSFDGKTMATGGWDKKIHLWDLESGQLKTTLEGHGSGILSIRFSRDNQHLLTTSNDGWGLFWKLGNPEPLKRFVTPAQALNAGAISPDPAGRFVAVGGEDGKVRVYDRENKFKLLRSIPVGTPVRAISFDNVGRHLYVAGEDQVIRMFQTIQGNLVRTFEAHTAPVNALDVSIDGNYLISGSDDKTAIIWNTKSGEPEKTLKGHGWKVLSVAFNPRAQYAVTSSMDGTIKLWDISTGQVIRTFEPKPRDIIYSAAFTPDTRKIISSSRIREKGDESVHIWDTGINLKAQMAEDNTPAENRRIIRRGADGN